MQCAGADAVSGSGCIGVRERAEDEKAALEKALGWEYPLVIGGGPCAYNPEPIAEFFDLFYIGEGETVYDELLDLYKTCRKEGCSRKEFLIKASQISGIYVPGLYEVTYKEDGTIAAFEPICADVPGTVDKQVETDMTSAPYPESPVVPFIKVTQDRVVLEIQRGCIRGCRFCQAGMLYRPTRERSLECLKEHAYKMLKSTGHEEISLSSVSSSDYSDLPGIVNFLIDEFRSQNINISLPSLRIDAFSLDVMSKVQDVRKSSLTFAPEAGSQRLRHIINKGLTKEIILKGADEAFHGGWNKVKLYFMLGLPAETEDDRKDIAHLANDIAVKYYEIPKDQRNGKCQITVSTSFFVPKPFTPFQWARMYTPGDYLGFAKTVNREIKEMLNQKSIRYNWHQADVTLLEGVFARGDRKIGKVIQEAYRLGSLYDAWTEYWNYDRWLQAFENTGIDMDFYTLRERDINEIFPWDFINIGVTKEFLKKEWQKAHEGIVTSNCKTKCSGCGAGKYKAGVCTEKRAAQMAECSGQEKGRSQMFGCSEQKESEGVVQKSGCSEQKESEGGVQESGYSEKKESEGGAQKSGCSEQKECDAGVQTAGCCEDKACGCIDKIQGGAEV